MKGATATLPTRTSRTAFLESIRLTHDFRWEDPPRLALHCVTCGGQNPCPKRPRKNVSLLVHAGIRSRSGAFGIYASPRAPLTRFLRPNWLGVVGGNWLWGRNARHGLGHSARTDLRHHHSLSISKLEGLDTDCRCVAYPASCCQKAF